MKNVISLIVIKEHNIYIYIYYECNAFVQHDTKSDG